MQIHIEKFSHDGCSRSVVSQAADATTALQRMSEDWSSTLSLQTNDGGVELMITASQGAYAALLRIGDSFYDLVENEFEEGLNEFIHGGQPALHPRRHIISRPLALEAASRFAHAPTTILGATGFTWEEQGTHESPRIDVARTVRGREL